MSSQGSSSAAAAFDVNPTFALPQSALTSSLSPTASRSLARSDSAAAVNRLQSISPLMQSLLKSPSIPMAASSAAAATAPPVYVTAVEFTATKKAVADLQKELADQQKLFARNHKQASDEFGKAIRALVEGNSISRERADAQHDASINMYQVLKEALAGRVNGAVPSTSAVPAAASAAVANGVGSKPSVPTVIKEKAKKEAAAASAAKAMVAAYNESSKLRKASKEDEPAKHTKSSKAAAVDEEEPRKSKKSHKQADVDEEEEEEEAARKKRKQAAKAAAKAAAADTDEEEERSSSKKKKSAPSSPAKSAGVKRPRDPEDPATHLELSGIFKNDLQIPSQYRYKFDQKLSDNKNRDARGHFVHSLFKTNPAEVKTYYSHFWHAQAKKAKEAAAAAASGSDDHPKPPAAKKQKTAAHAIPESGEDSDAGDRRPRKAVFKSNRAAAADEEDRSGSEMEDDEDASPAFGHRDVPDESESGSSADENED